MFKVKKSQLLDILLIFQLSKNTTNKHVEVRVWIVFEMSQVLELEGDFPGEFTTTCHICM